LEPAWWLHTLERDDTPTFIEYRHLIQLLLWRNPVPEGSVLVLKSPNTTPHLRESRTAFPEAAALACHRDPYRTVTSQVALAEAVARPFLSPGVSLDAVLPGGVHTILEVQDKCAGRLTTWALDGTVDGSVDYGALMADPVANSESALHLAGLTCSPDCGSQVAAFLDRPTDAWSSRRGETDRSVRQPPTALYAPR
jgi:hypothetical protein